MAPKTKPPAFGPRAVSSNPTTDTVQSSPVPSDLQAQRKPSAGLKHAGMHEPVKADIGPARRIEGAIAAAAAVEPGLRVAVAGDVRTGRAVDARVVIAAIV